MEILIRGRARYPVRDHRWLPEDHLYPQESQRLKSFIVAMMIFIFKNNFSTTSRGAIMKIKHGNYQG